ncbi:MAG: thioredoxin family protein [Flavobacteriales bacterium]
MKKISFLSLAALTVLSISAFTFCSNGNAKTAPSGDSDKTEVKKEITQPAAKKADPLVKAVKNNPAMETKMVDGMEWFTDLNKAYQESEETGKPILGFFTGSDWCGWCFKLHDNVLVKDEFKKWAEENVVLMEIDFPRRTKLDAELQQQNNNLKNVFKVSGFPTVWYFTAEKNEETGQLNLAALGKTGYPRATPGQEAATFIAASDAILAKQEAETAK